MIYLLDLCNFTKLSNICDHDLLKVLKHPIRIDRLINVTYEKQLQTGVRTPFKYVNMSITGVNIAPGRTPVSYPNQAFTNIVNPKSQFTIIMHPLRLNQQLFYRNARITDHITTPGNTGPQIYGGPGSLSHDFKIWPITFQGSGPSGPILFSCEKILL